MPLRFAIGLIAALLPLASAAVAQCPTAADMATGVRVTFDNGDRYELRALGGTLIEVTERDSVNPQALRFQADYGLYARTEVGLLANGVPYAPSTIDYSYPDGLPAPDAAAPDWQGERMVLEHGSVARPEGWQVGFRPMEAVTIGTCTYDAVAVGIRLRAGTVDQKDQYSYYLTALGAGFIVNWSSADGPQTLVPVQIEAMR